MKTSITAMTTGASFALAALLAIGAPSMSAAATFVYVSDAEDATIDAYVMDAKTGALSLDRQGGGRQDRDADGGGPQ